MRIKLFFLSLSFLGFFTIFSYAVAKEKWTQLDFDTTVKLQDHLSRRLDPYFSYFTILGSAEITLMLCLIMAVWSLTGLKWLQILGWLMIIPASAAEVFGKLVLFHPAPPVFLHRTSVFTHLPSFYVHTDFSYPSGHMTRTIFIVTIFTMIAFIKLRNTLARLVIISSFILLAFLMGLTRVYLGEHWLSDVIGGALLGAGTGFFASVLVLGIRRVDFKA